MRTRLSICTVGFFYGLSLSFYLMAHGINPKGFVAHIERVPACHVVSIGINQYGSGAKQMIYENPANDAKKLADSIRERYWKRKLSDLRTIVLPKKKYYTKDELAKFNPYTNRYTNTDSLVYLTGKDSLRLVSRKDSILSKWLFQHTLLNEQASQANILKAFSEVIRQSNPDDFFIFDFSGYTLNYKHPSGEREIYFIPYTREPLDTTALVRQGIPLRKLREMLEFVQATNQLIIVEAGDAGELPTQLAQILVDSDPAKAETSTRNRVMIAPNRMGMDYTFCDGQRYDNGPIHHVLMSLQNSDVFDIFSKGKQIMIEVWQRELTCRLEPQTDKKGFYTQFIFEQDLRQTIQLLRPKSSTRGVKVEGSPETAHRLIKGSHALLIGTKDYKGLPDWGGLKTPLNDVREIEKELHDYYGFQTKTLQNPSKDSVLAQLVHYAKTLDSTSQLLIYVAGHGGFDETFGDGYLVFADSKAHKQDPYRQTYLFYSQLSNMLDRMACRQIFLVLDVCFGGTFERTIAESPIHRTENKDELDKTVARLTINEFANQKLVYRTRQLLSSGGKQEVPDFYRGQPNSPFNQLFVSQLQSRGGDRGYLTASDFFVKVQDLPSEPVPSDFGQHDKRGMFFLVPLSKEELEKRQGTTGMR